MGLIGTGTTFTDVTLGFVNGGQMISEPSNYALVLGGLSIGVVVFGSKGRQRAARKLFRGPVRAECVLMV